MRLFASDLTLRCLDVLRRVLSQRTSGNSIEKWTHHGPTEVSLAYFAYFE